MNTLPLSPLDSIRPRPHFMWPVSASVRTPKGQVLVVLFLLLGVAVLGRPLGDWPATLAHLFVAVAAACLLDWPYLRVETGTWRIAPSSALITGLIVGSILAPGTPLDVVAVASLVSILGKRWLRIGRNHLFNPAVLGLLWVGQQFGSGESWWGALGDLSLFWALLVLGGGLLIADRLNKLPTVLVFLGANFGLWTATAFVTPTLAAELFRPPFVEAALYLAFFMLTDPPTSPNRVREQVLYALLAGLGSFLAMLLGAGQLYLLVGTLIANLWLGARRWFVHRADGARGQGQLVAGSIPISRGPSTSTT